MKTRKAYFDSKEFENTYHYEGRLGSFCGDYGTTFLVWAPTAENVMLNLYVTGEKEEQARQEALVLTARGVWVYETGENLEGSYYTYSVTVDGETRECGDPYAKACGVNGRRSMVVDMKKTNPLGFEEEKAPELPEENIIYEVHVKDFSWDPASGIKEAYRGKYPGLCQPGTTLQGDGLHPTGLDYLKELGVTHVQLMPVYDYGSVDETNPDAQYNWGYDPVNYNVPEGSYSSDPYHGEVRIRELKQAIMSLHANGFRVIMDVVYNHTYRKNSALDCMVPDYYYRQYEDGSWSNGSGCGNDTASERSMCGKYILDSVLYWAKEYHFDGFRFDLMGLIPVELMNRIRKALDETFGKGEKLVYGEPWRAMDTAIDAGIPLADKSNLSLLDPGIGAFCDSTRDSIKGSHMFSDRKGFVNGAPCNKDQMLACLKGWTGIPGEYSAQEPGQVINYISCHDDWALWDQLVNSLSWKDRPDYCKKDGKILRANRLAAAIMAGCQGNLFLLSGEEFGRTKMGVKNSFESPIEINRLDWRMTRENQALVSYYKGLFALRKQIPCLTRKDAEAGKGYASISYVTDNCLLVELEESSEKKSGMSVQTRWQKLLLIYSMGEEKVKVHLPQGQWQILIDGENSFLWKENCFAEKEVALSPMSAMILGK